MTQDRLLEKGTEKGGFSLHDSHPLRLTSAEYMAGIAVRIFRHTLTADVPLHWHEFYEVGFVTAGEGIHVLNGVRRPVRQGDIFLLTPADFHEVLPAPGSTLVLYDLIFTEEALSEDVGRLLFRTDQGAVQLSDPQIATLYPEFDRMWDEARSGRPGARILLRGALERILVEIARCLDVPRTGAESVGAGPQDPIQRALLFMQHHFREPLRLADVARQARLSPTYFSETFHKRTGTAFQQHLKHLRLGFARSLLRISALPVTEIADAAGFNTLNQFERSFKQKYSTSPSAYRKSLHGKAQ